MSMYVYGKYKVSFFMYLFLHLLKLRNKVSLKLMLNGSKNLCWSPNYE